MINKHKSNKIKENSNTVRHLNNGTDHRHSKSCCDQSSPARRTMTMQKRYCSVPTHNLLRRLPLTIPCFCRWYQTVPLHYWLFIVYKKQHRYCTVQYLVYTGYAVSGIGIWQWEQCSKQWYGNSGVQYWNVYWDNIGTQDHLIPLGLLG